MTDADTNPTPEGTTDAQTATTTDGQLVDGGDHVAVPSHDLRVTDDGQRVRLEWWHSDGVRARALFDIATTGNMALLVDVGCWAVSQTPVAVPEWSCGSLDHVPDSLLLSMKGAGYTPAERHVERNVPISEFMEGDE